MTNVLTLNEAEQVLDRYDIVIQTTSVGMKPNIDTQIISLDKLKSTAIISDIVYQPIMTQFLKEGKKRGASIHKGHTMLLYQAELAFNIWTEKQVEIGNMSLKLQTILEG